MDWNKKINFTKKDDSIKGTKVRKTPNKIKIPILSLEYIIIVYFTFLLYSPVIIEPLMPLLKPLFAVLGFLYVSINSIFVFLMGIMVIVLLIITYTDKLNGTSEPTIPDTPSGIPMFIYSIVKDCYFIFISYSLGHPYLAFLVVMSMLFVIFYKFIEKDMIAKMTKLTLINEQKQ